MCSELSCNEDYCNCSTHCFGQGCEEAENAYLFRNLDNIPLDNNCEKCLCKDDCRGQGCEESENL